MSMMMRTLVTMVIALALTIQVSASADLIVVTTTEDLASLAREVGGDAVSVEALARGYQDPHFVDAKPSFILKLTRPISWSSLVATSSRHGCLH